MKKIMPILAVLVVGILVLSGLGVSAITINKVTTVSNNKAIMDNQPPDAPKVTGPYFSKVGIPYECKIRAIDPDGDNVSYQIDWADGDISEWTVWYPSDEEISRSHNYSEKAHYSIKARAKDIHGAIGEWGHIKLGFSKITQQSSSMPNSQNTVNVIPSTGTTMVENQLPTELIIDGPTHGNVGEELMYCFLLTNQEGCDDIWYYGDWGDGTSWGWFGPVPSGITICTGHAWDEGGVYTIKAKAKDCEGSIYQATLEVTINEPPNKPEITGPTHGKIGEEYEYKVSAEDPEDHNVSYYIEWGDETHSGWTKYYQSGLIMEISHTWNKIGYYLIRCKAKDIYDCESEWSYMEIPISKNQAQSQQSNLDSHQSSSMPNGQISGLGVAEVPNNNDILGNRPPDVPSNPIPENGETDVPIDEIFINWDSEDPDGDDVRYDVYFGESSPPPLVVDNQVYDWYDPGIMDMYTTYYWQIVATDFWGESTTGPIWNFTTGSRINRPPNAPEITADVFYEGEDFVLYFINFTLTDPDGDNLKAYAVQWDKNQFAFLYKGNWPNGTIIEEMKGYGKGRHRITASCMDRYYKWGDDGYLEIELSKSKVQSTQQSSKEQTFSLQDTDSWEEIIDDIITRFQDAETQNEKIAILKEIPIVLDKYGLLPEDMTVGEMQELIVSSYLETIASRSQRTDKQSKVAGDSPLAVSKSVVHSSLPQFQVLGSNRIVNNNIKLNTPQPTPLFHYWGICFGLIYNLQYDGDTWWFNCYNVIVYARDFMEGERIWLHYTDGEEFGIPWWCCIWEGILTRHFVLVVQYCRCN